MKILVINPPCRDKSINRDMAGGLGYSAGEGVILPPIDLLNVVATLKKLRHKVDFLDAVAQRIEKSEVGKYLQQRGVDVVIMGLALPTIDEDIEFGKWLRGEWSGIRVIMKTGINYPEILERVLRQSRVERIIFGECDLTIGEYLDGHRLSGSAFWQGKKVVVKPLVAGDRVLEMDRLPLSPRNIGKINLYRYTLLPGVVTTMQTSRGCPYPCGFYCPYPLVQGTSWRAMSVGRVIKEIRAIKKWGISNILFRDATFTLDMGRAEKICQQMIKRRLKVKWWCETRINVLTPELLRLMKRAGCQGINVGIETLDQRLIVAEGKPGVTVAQVKTIRKVAKRLGVKLHFLMLIGLPNENLKTITNTFEYLVELAPESVGFSTITPYPGTEMFYQARKSGLINNFDMSRFTGNISNMRTKYLSEGDMGRLRWILSLTAWGLKRNWWQKTMIIWFNRWCLNIWRLWRKE